MDLKGLPSRSIVVLSCGHIRRVKNKKEYGAYYCIHCDNYHPIEKVVKNHRDH